MVHLGLGKDRARGRRLGVGHVITSFIIYFGFLANVSTCFIGWVT